MKRNQVRKTLEPLESREAPAALTFVSPAGVYATASPNGTATSAQVRSLVNSNSGDMVNRSAGNSQAYVSLSNYSGSSNYKTVDVTTSAYGRSSSYSTQAQAHTTGNYGAFEYVTVRVDPTQSDQYGDRVQVTLSPRFVSTIGIYNSGSASNNYSFYVNGGVQLSGNDTSRGAGEVFSKNITLTTTVGSTFTIAFLSKSYVGASNSIGNTAQMQFSLGMSVVKTGGGGSGGGGGGGTSGPIYAPSAPTTPTWSSLGGRDITLSWRDVANETSYSIQYWNANSGSWVNLTTVSSNSTSIRITNGLGYYFRVGASNSAGTNFSPYLFAGF